MKNNKTKNVFNSKKLSYIPLDDPSLVFTTYDLGLSAGLLCSGFELLSIDKDNPRKAMFIFKKTIDIEEASNQYFSDNLKVSSRKYFDNLKALKNMLYAEKTYY